MDKESRRRLLDAQVRRGEEAGRVLANPLVATAFTAMEADIINTMKRLKPDETDALDMCWRELRALERFRGRFKGYLQTGEQAKKTLMQTIKEKL